MRVLVFGGREFTDELAVFSALDAVLAKHGPFELVHGCARGADSLADLWFGRCATDDCAIRRHPADWSRHGRRAGPIRNAEMLARGIDAAVGFPGGRGTADMARRLRAAGVITWWPCGGDPCAAGVRRGSS